MSLVGIRTFQELDSRRTDSRFANQVIAFPAEDCAREAEDIDGCEESTPNIAKAGLNREEVLQKTPR